MVLSSRSILISIHAPARGATYLPCIASLNCSAFQSTLPRGERPGFTTVKQYVQNFNPRSREGSDYLFENIIYHALISIHAPARGATLYLNQQPAQNLFQSTLPRGERLPLTYATTKLLSFQSTLPRGERLYRMVISIRVHHFNPRSREGSDCKNTQTTNIISVYFYLYYIIFVSLATNTAYITITKPSKCRCESPYTFC